MRALTLTALAFAAAAPSCYLGETQVQKPFTADAVGKMQPGVTTAQEVANLLGAPTRVVEIGGGSAWLYEHAVAKDAALWLLLIVLRGNDTQTDRIWVFFDGQGRLTHAAASFDADSARYAFPPMS